MSVYIHQKDNWSNFSWNNDKLLNLLSTVRKLQGRLVVIEPQIVIKESGGGRSTSYQLILPTNGNKR